ncbi:MAG TPA: lantibiotic dehydratase [Candidatus Angelobacter sp.]|nr:lantibiotic dehydratase [Candidatus Angelobacter sp.]
MSQDLLAPGTLRNGGDLAEACASDRKLVRCRLQELVRRPEIKEALWIASPEFFESLSTWWNKPESEKGQKLEQSLYRYVARMISRSTPFGLFAACATGEIGNETRLELGARDTYWRRSRLDMEYLCNLAEKVSSDPALRNQLRFRPNTSLYLAAGRHHHAQSYYQEKMRLYRLVATEQTPYLKATLERASGGATPHALAQALVKDEPDIPLEEAEQYLGQLIESQLLVAELVPPITGPEPIDDMIEQLKQAEAPSLAEPLISISSCLQEIDKQSVGVDLAQYQRIVDIVSQLPATFKVEHLIQVDAMKPAPHACLDQRLISDILRAVETLHSIIPAYQPESLKEFKEQFQERYEAREVPLLQVLDEEVGIGFERKDNAGALAEPLLEGIDIAAERQPQEFRSGKSEFILLRKIEELLRERATVLSLDKKLIEDLRVDDPLPLPDAFAVMGAVSAPLDSSPAKKNSFHFQSVSGPSGANLLGRFCHAHDRLKSGVEDYLRTEEKLKGNAVFAEIVHLPEGRIGNVLFRPILREYEIPYLATSRMPFEKQIPVSDLMVSVQEERVVLRSRRLGREVLPRMTTAHGYSHARNLKLYKFLCLLQLQGVAPSLVWNWGVLEQAAFLPRVVFGNIIFSLARWKLSKEIIEQLSKPQGPDRLRAVTQWREKNKVPRFVYVTEADNQLLIDFDNALSVEVLIDYIKKRPEAKLVEMLHDPTNLCVRGPEGTFVNEVVIPFVRNPTTQKPQLSVREAESKSTSDDQQPVAAESDLPLSKPLARSPVPAQLRSFLPGSEWLYAKIYASPSHMDRLLIQAIRPLAQKVLSAGQADHWFFIRYSDPHLHLRLRFHGDPKRLSSDVLPQIWECTNPEIQRGTLWRVQLDTYEREVERYGGLAGIHIAERFFHLDSELVLDLLTALHLSGGAAARWQAACYSVDRLLSGLGFNASQKRELVNKLGKYYEKNFSVDQRYKKQLSEKFRNERSILERIIGGSEELDTFPPEVHRAIASYTERLKIIHAELEEKRAASELAQSIPELASSYIHMHLNRMFRSAQNAQEMVLYDFLARTYDSKLAKEKRSEH